MKCENSILCFLSFSSKKEYHFRLWVIWQMQTNELFQSALPSNWCYSYKLDNNYLVVLAENSQIKQSLLGRKISQVICRQWLERGTFPIVAMLKRNNSCSKLLCQNLHSINEHKWAWKERRTLRITKETWENDRFLSLTHSVTLSYSSLSIYPSTYVQVILKFRWTIPSFL